MRSPCRALLLLSVVALAALGLSACAPVIGDGCDDSFECSVNGDRFCDGAQPGGYCTVVGCDPDTCPDDALCVEWRFEPSRLAESWCMRSCKNTSSCDRGPNYGCVFEGDEALLDENGQPLARVLDLNVPRDEFGTATTGFCAAVYAQ